MRAGHERGLLFMANLDEFDLIVEALQSADQTIDAVAGVTIDAPDTPFVETVNDEIADILGHAKLPPHRGIPLCASCKTEQACLIATEVRRGLVADANE